LRGRRARDYPATAVRGAGLGQQIPFGLRHRGQPALQPQFPDPHVFGQSAVALGGDPHQHLAAVARILGALHQAEGLEPGQHAGDRRRADLLLGGQVTRGERALAPDHGERGQLGQRQPVGRGLLPEPPGQAVH